MVVAVLLVASACSSGAETTTPVITVASTTTSTTATLAPTATQAPTTTTTPPTITLPYSPDEYWTQLVGEECVYLYPGRGGIGRLVGMDETAARTEVERCGWVFRVIHRDGADLTITANFHNQRVNVVIVNRVVRSVTQF